MVDNNNARSGGIGFFGLLGIVFITLKLCGVIDWEWWLVLAPIWVPVLVVFVVVFIITLVDAVRGGKRWDCPRFEDCEAKECKRGACDYFDTWDSVVCSVNSGGCGAAGGYASCPAKAAEKWNRRAERTCKRVLFEPTGVLVCSECGAGMPKQLDKYCYLHYCPNCGAKVVSE